MSFIQFLADAVSNNAGGTPVVPGNIVFGGLTAANIVGDTILVMILATGLFGCLLLIKILEAVRFRNKLAETIEVPQLSFKEKAKVFTKVALGKESDSLPPSNSDLDQGKDDGDGLRSGR